MPLLEATYRSSLKVGVCWGWVGSDAATCMLLLGQICAATSE